MKVTPAQKEAIKSATAEKYFCTIAHKRTMRLLVDKGLAKYSGGYGYYFGDFIQLTEEGKKLQKSLTK